MRDIYSGSFTSFWQPAGADRVIVWSDSPEQFAQDLIGNTMGFATALAGVALCIIECRCERRHTFQKASDIPRHSLRCDCGAWVVKYERAV